MTALINASTSSGVVVTSDTSGSLAFQSNGTSIATISSTGLTMNSGNIVVASTAAPAFYVFLNSNQTPSAGVTTKIQLNTKVFDTASCFDTSTYRFTPNVAGYYQFIGGMSPTTTITAGGVRFYKNGSLYILGNDTNTNPNCIQGSALIYLNGTTDYVELYSYVSAGGFFGNANPYYTYFQGFLARSA